MKEGLSPAAAGSYVRAELAGKRRYKTNDELAAPPPLESEHIMQKGPAIVVSTIALLMIVLAVANLPDITRYVKISRM